MAIIPSAVQYILIVCFVHSSIGILCLFILCHYLAPHLPFSPLLTALVLSVNLFLVSVYGDNVFVFFSDLFHQG